MTKKSAATKLTDAEQVKAHMNEIKHSLKAEMEVVRKIIKGVDKRIGERIKWNAPSYYFHDDIITFGPVKEEKLLLVFHHPLIEKIKSPLLEGKFKGRRLAYFSDLKEIKSNRKELESIIIELISGIEKRIK